MKIGLVTQAYYPVLGGVTEHVWHLGQELQRRGHDVTIITGHSRLADDRGLRVLRHGFQIPLVFNGANMNVTWGWKLGRRLQRIEAKEQFDLIHIQSPLDPGLPLIATKSMRTPKVGTYHTWRDGGGFGDLLPRVFHPIFLDAFRKLAAHIAVSPAAEDFVRRYTTEGTMTVIPNGVDTKRFTPDGPTIDQLTDDIFTILYVGRMDPRKGAKFLLAALPYLESALTGQYRLVVVGTGWLQKYYDALIPLQLRSRVTFAGYASPEDLPRYYRSADVYCSPATGGEAFGIVLAEAMACGRPVVASDIAGYRWVIEPGREGLLVPPRHPRLLAEAIVALAKDPARRQAMGRAGRQKALTFSWPLVVDRIETVYRRVLDGQSG